MMIRQIALIGIFLGLGRVFSQDLEIPFSESPTIDGNFSLMEWADADSIFIELNSLREVKVFYMHDSSSFYAAFVNNLQSGGNYFPELLFDSDYDTSNSFQPDDWWFHVSATDCEYQGEYGNYSNCSLTRPNWKAMPNFTVGNTVDTVEIEVPLSTIQVSIHDTIGMGFLLNNFLDFKQYPKTLNHLSPNTFLSAAFEPPNALGLNEKNQFAFLKVYPVPNSGVFKLFLKDQKRYQFELKLTNLLGEIIYREDLDKRSESLEKRIDISTYPKGIYLITLTSGLEHISKKIIVQ